MAVRAQEGTGNPMGVMLTNLSRLPAYVYMQKQTRGEKLGHLSLKVPQPGGKAINVQFDFHANDDRSAVHL